MRLFLLALKDDIDIRLNLLLEELLHLSYIIRFLAASNKESNIVYSCRPTDIFFGLYNYAREVSGKLVDLIVDWKDLREVVENFSEENEISKPGEFFKSLVDIQNRIGGSIDVIAEGGQLLPKFDFLQKKLLSYQSGSQHYYPHPKITSIKEAIKIHLYMENIAREFLKLFKVDKTVLFFWDYSPDVRFFGDEKNALIINTDLFLPNRQSHWIILFHEVIHYLIIQKTENLLDKNKFSFDSELLNLMVDYIEDTYNDCRIAACKYNFDYVPTISIEDIFIDSLLTSVFGISYLLPVSVRLFAYDEISFLYPTQRSWFIRLSVLSEIFSARKEEENYFKRDLKRMLERYRYVQTLRSSDVIDEDFFSLENLLKAVILNKVKDFLRESRCLRRDLLRNLENSLWLRTYIRFVDYYTRNYLKNRVEGRLEKREGRAICFLYQELCCQREKGYRKDEKVLNKIEEGFKKKVFKFNLFKFRFDLPENVSIFEVLEEHKDSKFLWGLSNFNILLPETKEVHEKVDTIENMEVAIERLNLLFRRKLIETRSNNISFEDSLLKDFFFYKEELSLTLMSENYEDLKKTLQESQNHVFVFVKFLCKNSIEETENFESCWKHFYDLFDKTLFSYKERMKTFIFSSFDWFNYCVLLAVSGKERNINLEAFLRELKETVLLNNNWLLRTETLIFVGNRISNKVMLPNVNVLIRISSQNLGKGKRLINSMKRSGFKISSSFGIKDIVVHLETGRTISTVKELIDKMSFIIEGAKKEGIKISDIQVEPFVYWNNFVFYG